MFHLQSMAGRSGGPLASSDLDLWDLAQYIARYPQPARFKRISGAALKSPEQKSLLVGSSFERGLGATGLFGFPEILIVR